MATHNNVPSDALKMEQILTELFAKSLHVIFEARFPSCSSCSDQSSPSSSSSVRPRDKWFNLGLKDCPTSLDNFDFFRQSNLEFLVIDILLLDKEHEWKLDSANENSEKVIERWMVKYENKNEGELGFTGKKLTSTLQNSYKRVVILLRSLYAFLRLLPANKLIQELNSSGEMRGLTVTHRVSSFVEPFTRREEAEMQEFSLSSVLTPGGRFSISVRYRPSLTDLYTDSSPSLSPKVISNYVGSPLAHPLQRFPSFPTPESSPMSCPRRHSWSLNRSRASSPSSSLLPYHEHSNPANLSPKFDRACFPYLSPFSNILRSESAPPQIKGFIVGDSSNEIAICDDYDLDKVEDSCPFHEDNEEEEREGLVGDERKKSRQALVGELVNMMRGSPLTIVGEETDLVGAKTIAGAFYELCVTKKLAELPPFYRL